MEELISAFQAGLAQVPQIVIIMVLLVGPTVAWFGYRAYVAPRSKLTETPPESLFWICGACKSANEARHRRCYHCKTDRDANPGALRVLDHDRLYEIEVIEPDAEPDAEPFFPGLVPVGPGHAEVPATMAAPAAVVAARPKGSATSLGARPDVAGGVATTAAAMTAAATIAVADQPTGTPASSAVADAPPVAVPVAPPQPVTPPIPTAVPPRRAVVVGAGATPTGRDATA